MVPSFSADFTIAPAIRSFTDAVGLKLSSLAIISALQLNSLGNRLSLTKGVWPTREVMSLAIGMIVWNN